MPPEAAAAAVGALEPERERVQSAVERRGATPRTLAYLARRGFGDEALERFVAPDG